MTHRQGYTGRGHYLRAYVYRFIEQRAPQLGEADVPDALAPGPELVEDRSG